MTYLTLLFTAFISACFAVYFADMSGIMDGVKRFTKYFWGIKRPNGVRWARRLKPFDCSMCLSFWICLYLTWNNGYVESFGSAAIAGVMSVWILKQVRK